MTIDPTLAGLVAGAIGLALLLSVLVVRALRARRRPAEAPDVEVESAEVVQVESADAAAPRERHTFWRLRRPRRTTSAETSSEPVAETTATYDVLPEPEPVEPEPVEPEPVGSDRESLAVRSLRAQVRTLEQTIEDLRELTDRLPATEPAEVPADEEPAAAYRRQVELSLRALAARPLPDESAAHALARAVAAVERLDGVDRLVRPALPRTAGEPAAAPAVLTPAAQVPAAQVPAAQVPAVPAVPAGIPLVASAPVVSVPAPAPAPAAVVPPTQPMVAVPTWTEEPAPAEDVLDAVPEVEVVLPVPPPLVAEPRRNRRWRRHAA